MAPALFCVCVCVCVSVCFLLPVGLAAQADDPGAGNAPDAPNAPEAAPAAENPGQGAEGDAAADQNPRPETLLKPRPADARGDDYDWDRPNPWSRRPRDRTRPPITQEDARRPNLEKMRDSRGRVLLRYARELAATGSLEPALDRYRNFLVLYPRHEWRLEALLGSADILLELDRVEQAIGYLEQAYRDGPHRERAALGYLRAGKLYADMGRFDEARRIFTQLAGAAPASRVSRLATIELNSLGFLDSKTDGGKTGRAENTPRGEPAPVVAPVPAELPPRAPDAGEAAGDGSAETRPGPVSKPAETEGTKRDALDRMGEGVEEL